MNDPVEVTVVMRFEYRRPPDESSIREALETLFDCDVVEYEEEDI